MRRMIVIGVMLLLGASSAFAQPLIPDPRQLSAGASISAECRWQVGRFVVPSGMKAVRLRADLSSSWIPCAGAGSVPQIGFRIVAPSGAVLAHVTSAFGTGRFAGADELGKLELAPGAYAVEVSEGGKLTEATVSGELIPATQPTSGTISAEAQAIAARGEPAVIGGEWRDPEVGSRAIVKQEGARIYVINSFVWEKKRVEWQGHGTFDGKIARLEFAFTTAPPKGWEDGTMELALVDAKTLKGFWKTATGSYSRNITFLLVKPGKKPALPAKPKSSEKPAAPARAPSSAPPSPGKVDMTNSGGPIGKEER